MNLLGTRADSSRADRVQQTPLGDANDIATTHCCGVAGSQGKVANWIPLDGGFIYTVSQSEIGPRRRECRGETCSRYGFSISLLQTVTEPAPLHRCQLHHLKKAVFTAFEIR